jgi:hypothetical protein
MLHAMVSVVDVLEAHHEPEIPPWVRGVAELGEADLRHAERNPLFVTARDIGVQDLDPRLPPRHQRLLPLLATEHLGDLEQALKQVGLVLVKAVFLPASPRNPAPRVAIYVGRQTKLW